MCTLKELEDGTYSINDLVLMHDLIDVKEKIKEAARPKEEEEDWH
jgi:hypothetical protein